MNEIYTKMLINFIYKASFWTTAHAANNSLGRTCYLPCSKYIRSQMPQLAGDYCDWQGGECMANFVLLASGHRWLWQHRDWNSQSLDMVNAFSFLHHSAAPWSPHINSKNQCHACHSGCVIILIKVQSLGHRMQWGKK